MKAGIIARADKPEAATLTRSLMEALGTRGVEVLLEARTAEAVGARGVDEQQLGAACDLLIVLGGDGTILRALHRVRGEVPPIFGINVGSLGFLTGVHGEEWPKAVESIAAGDFRLSARTMLRVELVRGGATVEALTGLNDAVVQCVKMTRLHALWVVKQRQTNVRVRVIRDLAEIPRLHHDEVHDELLLTRRKHDGWLLNGRRR
jgi:NAD+ kinase